MSYDLMIRGGKVIDGSGTPAFAAPTAIRDGRIAKVRRVAETATRVIDVDGAVVTPGFIDLRTHYDVQLDWTRALKEQLEAAGCSIPYPQRDVHMQGGTGEAPKAA